MKFRASELRAVAYYASLLPYSLLVCADRTFIDVVLYSSACISVKIFILHRFFAKETHDTTLASPGPLGDVGSDSF